MANGAVVIEITEDEFDRAGMSRQTLIAHRLEAAGAPVKINERFEVEALRGRLNFESTPYTVAGDNAIRLKLRAMWIL